MVNKYVDKVALINRFSNVNPYVWIGFIMLIGLLVRSYHITYPIYDMHSFRQTQTAGLIRDYYREGIDLLYPKMITLGDPGYVVLEFPLYQALAAFLYKYVAPDLITARLLSIICGLLSILFIYRISKKFLDQNSAIFASLVFAFVPLNIFYSRVPMSDALTILLSLVMLDFLIEGIKGKPLYLIFGIVAASLGLILKSPYVGFLYLPLLYVAYRERKGGFKSLSYVRFLASFIIPVAVMVLWQRHANHVNDVYFTNDYPFRYLYPAVVVKLYPLNHWYFGSIEQRLNFDVYVTLWDRIQKDIMAYVGMPFLFFGLIALAKKRQILFYVWLLSAFISIMIFFNVNRVHNYYQLPVAAILSIFCGAGFTYLRELTIKLTNKKMANITIFVLVLAYILVNLIVVKAYFQDEGNKSFLEVGEFIDRSVDKDALIVTSTQISDLWWPVLMYYSDRHGFMLPHSRLDNEMMTYFRTKGIRYLALVDYKDAGGMIPHILAPYQVKAGNDRVIIYDISH